MMPDNFDERSIPDFILTVNRDPTKLEDGASSWWQDSFMSLDASDADCVSLFSDDDDDESTVGEQEAMRLEDDDSKHCHCNSPPRRGKDEDSCADCGLPPLPQRQPSCHNLVSLLKMEEGPSSSSPLNDSRGCCHGQDESCHSSKKTGVCEERFESSSTNDKPPRIRSRAIRRRKQLLVAACSNSKTTATSGPQRRVLPPRLPRRKGSNVSSMAS